jgi:hypothetical protein
MSTSKLKPYADDATSLSIDGLTLENGRDRVAVYGNLDLTRDKQGLQHARDLKAVLDEVVRILEADKSLPNQVPPSEKAPQVKNPFA